MGSGKDAAGRMLTEFHGYQRVAFADPLKQMVIEADPIVKYEPTGFGPVPVHLSDVLRRMDFDTAKRTYREVRRSLQQIGQGARKIDPDFWVRLALKRIDELSDGCLPIVVTDCRYPNEIDALRMRGFLSVRIVSDRQDSSNTHESETALDRYMTEYEIMNCGTLDELHGALRDLI
jgi:dephospho-CoA kinase